MKFTKKGNLKKETEMKIRATGFSNQRNYGLYFTLSTDNNYENKSTYMQFTPEEARQIINSWENYFKEYEKLINLQTKK